MAQQTTQVTAFDAVHGDREAVSRRARELLENGSEAEFQERLGL